MKKFLGYLSGMIIGCVILLVFNIEIGKDEILLGVELVILFELCTKNYRGE